MQSPTEAHTKLGGDSWVRVSFMVLVLGACVWLLNGFGKLDTRAAVLEVNSTHANQQLGMIANTLEKIAEKQDGEREKLGQLDARVTIVEGRVEAVERKNEGK